MVAAISTRNPTSSNPIPAVLARRSALMLDNQPRITPEDIRIHAWICDRVSALHRERNSLRAKAARLLFGHRANV